MKPIIKYRGGKQKEIPDFINRIPQDYHRYFEPFLGGGAVYFHMEPEQAVVGDVNPKLITFYQQLRDNYPLMQKQLDQLQQQYEANQYEYEELTFFRTVIIILSNKEHFGNYREIVFKNHAVDDRIPHFSK